MSSIEITTWKRKMRVKALKPRGEKWKVETMLQKRLTKKAICSI